MYKKNSNAMLLGTVIKAKRIALGISQNTLAQVCNISRAEISRIEVGQKLQPSTTNLKVISEALKINYIELLILAQYFTYKEIQEFLDNTKGRAVI